MIPSITQEPTLNGTDSGNVLRNIPFVSCYHLKDG